MYNISQGNLKLKFICDLKFNLFFILTHRTIFENQRHKENRLRTYYISVFIKFVNTHHLEHIIAKSGCKAL